MCVAAAMKAKILCLNTLVLRNAQALPSTADAAQYAPVQVKAPRVAESAVHLECKLRHNYPVNNK